MADWERKEAIASNLQPCRCHTQRIPCFLSLLMTCWCLSRCFQRKQCLLTRIRRWPRRWIEHVWLVVLLRIYSIMRSFSPYLWRVFFGCVESTTGIDLTEEDIAALEESPIDIFGTGVGEDSPSREDEVSQRASKQAADTGDGGEVTTSPTRLSSISPVTLVVCCLLSTLSTRVCRLL